MSRADLVANGFSAKGITRAVKSGDVTRLRRNHYVVGSSARADADKAIRIGGRLSCISAIALAGDDVFVMTDGHVHVQVPRAASRLRSPDATSRPANARDNRASRRARRWNRTATPSIRLHWDDHTESPHSCDSVALADAVRQLVRCQSAQHVVATLDSLLHHGLMTRDALEEVFDGLPPRYRVLFRLVDARAESGTESLVRLMLRRLGAQLELQVTLSGVGRVDIIVDGWLIIECDSKAHHEGWDAQRRDRRRDLAAARLGYTTVRLLAEDILYRPDEIFQALRQTLAFGSRRVR